MTDVAGERERLTQAGWAVTDLRDNVVRVEGTLLDVTVGAASRGHLRARFARLGACVDGDLTDRMFVSCTAARRLDGTKYRAEVLDTGRALEEVGHLASLFEVPDFPAALARVEARGFAVDREASVEDTYDAYTWTIRARSPVEQLDVHLRFGLHGLPERGADGFVNMFEQAELRRPNAVLTVAVHALTRAEELLDLLVPPRTPAPQRSGTTESP